MRCPFCSNLETQVKDSRPSEDGSFIKRRRFCPECGSRFTTLERIQLREVIVVKKDGNKAPFDRDKLMRSIRLACKKREIDEIKLEKMVNSIQRQIEVIGDEEIKSERIGELVMESLINLDVVAYIRFASVYKDFDTLADFEQLFDIIKKHADNIPVKDKKNINQDKKNVKDNLFE